MFLLYVEYWQFMCVYSLRMNHWLSHICWIKLSQHPVPLFGKDCSFLSFNTPQIPHTKSLIKLFSSPVKPLLLYDRQNIYITDILLWHFSGCNQIPTIKSDFFPGIIRWSSSVVLLWKGFIKNSGSFIKI